MPQIAFDPMQTTTATGSFAVQSDGYVQGSAMDDPSVRNFLSGGILSPTDQLPMYGGLAITEGFSAGEIYPATPIYPGQDTLGGNIRRATSVADITGFSVFNQAHSWIQLPGSDIPICSPGQTVNFYRLHSGARIPVAMDPALVNAAGRPITSQFSWDFNLMRLTPYEVPEPVEPITTLTWAAGVVTAVTPAPHGHAVGDDVTIAGETPAGYNGDFSIASVPSPTSFTYPLAVNPGPQVVAGQVNAGGGQLPVRLLSVHMGNSKMVSVDPITGALRWTNAGNAALILI